MYLWFYNFSQHDKQGIELTPVRNYNLRREFEIEYPNYKFTSSNTSLSTLRLSKKGILWFNSNTFFSRVSSIFLAFFCVAINVLNARGELEFQLIAYFIDFGSIYYFVPSVVNVGLENDCSIHFERVEDPKTSKNAENQARKTYYIWCGISPVFWNH